MLARLLLLALTLFACAGGEQKSASEEPKSILPPVLAPTPSGPPEDARPATGRVVVIGLPGVDPDWVDRWRRDLPNLDGLLGGQRNARMETTFPPSAAAAWTTFATGSTPGSHGVYGLIGRDPVSYQPTYEPMRVADPVYGVDGSLISAPRATPTWEGQPFWRAVAAAGLRVKLLFVPWVWPSDEPAGVEALAGMGFPDLLLTNSTFTLFGSDFGERELSAELPGGQLSRLVGAAPMSALIPGPEDARGQRVDLPLQLALQGVDRVVITAGGQQVEGRVGTFTPWVTLRFPLSDKVTAVGRARFFPIEIGERTRLYMTPIAVDPREPWMPVASPPAFGQEVFQTYGDWKAMGWPYDTAGLSSDLVPEAVLASEIRDLYERRLQIVLGELGRRDAELLVAVLPGTDVVSHMFMRLGDPSHPAYDERIAGAYGGLLKDTYVDMDRAVGRIREKLKPGDTLIVLSESGFQSFRRDFEVNTWLLEHGWLALAPGVARSAENVVSKDQIDWRKTSAYSFGSGFVYLNLKGREAQGSLPPARARQVLQQIASGLLEVRDGRSPVFSRVLLGADLYRGPAAARAPDLVLAFMDGYQVGKATTLGRIPLTLLADNKRRWSGDHSASDPNDVQGLLATNLEAPPKAPRLVDVGPTVQALLGVTPPADAEGRSWVDVRSRVERAQPTGR